MTSHPRWCQPAGQPLPSSASRRPPSSRARPASPRAPSRSWVLPSSTRRTFIYGLVVVEIPEPGLRSILVDTARAIASVVGHLADLGHHEIGYFSADYPSAVFARRFRHCAQAARRRDVRLRTEPSWRATCDVETMTATAHILLDSGVGAATSDDDLRALALHRAAAERGRLIPDDLSIVGYGDLDLARLVNPELTSVRLPAGPTPSLMLGASTAQVGTTAPGRPVRTTAAVTTGAETGRDVAVRRRAPAAPHGPERPRGSRRDHGPVLAGGRTSNQVTTVEPIRTRLQR